MFKLFGGDAKKTEPQAAPSSEGLWKSIVSATSLAVSNTLGKLGQGGQFTETDWDTLEETLIRSDMGVDLAVEIVEHIRRNPALQNPEKIREYLTQTFIANLGNQDNTLHYREGKLNIYLVVGVNGAGKTTLIGKLAHRFKQQGKSVVIGAGDTFRAAAEDQLAVWAQRAGVDIITKETTDAAAVIFETLAHAKKMNADVAILDTAGRLQNKHNLMEELKKIKSIIDRESPADANYEALVVIDATTGQNALSQAKIFQEAVNLTGVALTKLDGSAKGGIVLNIAKTCRLPVKLVGTGEKIEDLEDFNAEAFVAALFNL